jgi:multiple sugar transport system ATP-binding protein
MAAVRLESVSKTFGKNVVVQAITMEVPDREFLVLVGPSGCGKTTTLRMIAGLETISGGKIYIGDRVVNDVEPRDRNIAMVFQNYALYPHMNVYENMAFALQLRKMSREEIDKRVKTAADILGIGHLLLRRPKEMSGGQRRRAALGRAMVRDPDVFLMDEPLSNLDAKLRVQMRVELVQLHRRVSTTTVYVTHGSEQLAFVLVGRQNLLMRTSPDTPLHSGASIDLTFNTAKMHAFDPQSGATFF